MKASLPFKYIITSKNGKQYVVFDFKDDNGERRRKWVSTGLSEKCIVKYQQNILTFQIKCSIIKAGFIKILVMEEYL